MSEVNGNGKRESIKVERDGLELEGGSSRMTAKKTPEPWEGDHGFSGLALLAWERQRQAYLMVDEHGAWRTDKDPKIRGQYALLLAWARGCPCPQTLGPGGTSEGADWVSQKRPCPYKPDLAGANLTGANLTGADLTGADLEEWERGEDGYARRKTAKGA